MCGRTTTVTCRNTDNLTSTRFADHCGITLKDLIRCVVSYCGGYPISLSVDGKVFPTRCK